MKKEVWETVIADIEKDIAEELDENTTQDMLDLYRSEGMLLAVNALLYYDNDVSNRDKIEITNRIQKNLSNLL